MAGGKEVRERIASVNSTQQITKAMKMVSAAKLRKASDAIQDLRPYALKLQDILSNVMASLGEGEDLGSLSLAKTREINNVLLVLVTSDRGLCGGFNANLVKTAKAQIEEKYSSQAAAGKVTLMTVGKKGYDAFKDEGIDVNQEFIGLFHDLSFDNSRTAAEFLVDAYLTEKYDAIDVVFSEFKNAATQIFQADQFLPVKISAVEKASDGKEYKADYIFEPEKTKVLEELIPKILKTQFHRYLLDNNASEHGARMMAMDQATENANDLLKELKLSYNRARQAAITTEISEIVGGVAALEG